MKSRNNLFSILISVNLFTHSCVAQSDTIPIKKISIELSGSVVGIITDYANNQLYGLGGSFVSAKFGINKNKNKYTGGVIFQYPGFLGYSTTKIGTSLCYQYFPNPERKFNFYFLGELKYIYSSFSGKWYKENPIPPPNAYAEVVKQRFNTINMAIGYGFYINIYKSFSIGTDIEAGAGVFSFNENKEIVDYPQLSSSYNTGIFENKHFSFGAKVNLMYNFK